MPPTEYDWDLPAAARTRTLDARDGFEKMADLAEPAFRPTVAGFLDLHIRHGEELTRHLADAGHAPGDDGSFMGRANRLVVAARAAVDQIDADVLGQIHSGEAHAVAAYERALDARLPERVRSRHAILPDDLQRLLASTGPRG